MSTKSFDTEIAKINKFIAIDPLDRMDYTNSFNNVRDYVKNQMCKDATFGQIFNGSNLGGSYADNLKISKPDEFDLVIQLKLPDHKLIKLERVPNMGGYVNINIRDLLKKLENEKQNKEVYTRLKKLVDDESYLLQQKFLSWIQSLVSNVIRDIPYGRLNYNGRIYNLKYSMHGPAHTLEVVDRNMSYSIDFVPALVFDKSVWIGPRQVPSIATRTNWIAIPKPIPKASNDNRAWITSYVDAERALIGSKNTLKQCIRLMKKIRDRYNIANMKSYFIKTVFLWRIDNEPNYNWNQPVTVVLIDNFKYLLTFTEKAQMPFFWDRTFNMFGKLSAEQKTAIHNQWQAIYKNILKALETSDKVKFYNIFLMPQEVSIINPQNQSVNERVVQQNDSYCLLS